MKKGLFISILLITTLLIFSSCSAPITVTRTVERAVPEVTTITSVVTITQPPVTVIITAPPVTLSPKTTVVTTGQTTQNTNVTTTTTTTSSGGIASLNQPVTVGTNAKWTVTKAQNEGSTLPASEYRYSFGATSRTTTGKFIRISFTVENIGNKTVTYPDDPTLVDSNGREYSPADSYYEYVPEGMDFLDVKLQPNLPVQCQIIYEVPQNAVGLSFKVTDLTSSFLSSYKTALISLGF